MFGINCEAEFSNISFTCSYRINVSLVPRPIPSFSMFHAEAAWNIEKLGMGLGTRLILVYHRKVFNCKYLLTKPFWVQPSKLTLLWAHSIKRGPSVVVHATKLITYYTCFSRATQQILVRNALGLYVTAVPISTVWYLSLCNNWYYGSQSIQERERALSLFEEGGPSLVATSDKVTTKGPDYNELVISVNKCHGLISNTSGIHVVACNCCEFITMNMTPSPVAD